MGVSDVVLAMKDRIDNQLLIQLTNELPTATTINDTRLTAACTDAIGEFQMLSGIAFDSTNTTHMAIIINGVRYFLELYKGREGASLESYGKKFYNKSKGLRETAIIAPTTNAKAYPSQEKENSLPDMDRSRGVFSNGYRGLGTSNSSKFSGDQ